MQSRTNLTKCLLLVGVLLISGCASTVERVLLPYDVSAQTQQVMTNETAQRVYADSEGVDSSMARIEKMLSDATAELHHLRSLLESPVSYNPSDLQADLDSLGKADICKGGDWVWEDYVLVTVPDSSLIFASNPCKITISSEALYTGTDKERTLLRLAGSATLELDGVVIVAPDLLAPVDSLQRCAEGLSHPPNDAESGKLARSCLHAATSFIMGGSGRLAIRGGEFRGWMANWFDASKTQVNFKGTRFRGYGLFFSASSGNDQKPFTHHIEWETLDLQSVYPPIDSALANVYARHCVYMGSIVVGSITGSRFDCTFGAGSRAAFRAHGSQQVPRDGELVFEKTFFRGLQMFSPAVMTRMQHSTFEQAFISSASDMVATGCTFNEARFWSPSWGSVSRPRHVHLDGTFSDSSLEVEMRGSKNSPVTLVLSGTVTNTRIISKGVGAVVDVTALERDETVVLKAIGEGVIYE